MKRLVAAEVLISLAVFALQEVPRGHGLVTLAYVVVLGIALPFLPRARAARGGRRPGAGP